MFDLKAKKGEIINMAYKKKLSAIFLAAIMSLALCSCSNTDGDTPFALSVVVGAHSNAGSIPLNTEAITSQLYQVARTQGDITIIRADGAPAVVFQTTIPELPTDGLSENKQKAIAGEYVGQLQGVLDQLCAEVPEVDTLEAIRLGASALSKEGQNKVLLVLDTGLSSTGYLDFTQGLLNAEPEAVVAALDEAEALPELDGISVLWALCGQTAAPQTGLSEREKKSLQSIWEAVLTAGGAEDVQFLSDFAGEAYVGLPAVSLVPTEQRALQVEIPMTVLSDAQVRFRGDSDQFVDIGAATQALNEAAAELLAHPDRQAYLIGTTASGSDDDYCLDLSRRRAEATKKLLVEGWDIPEEQLTCVGMGDKDPWHIDDRGSDGYLIESLASQNRKVILMDVKSEMAAAVQNWR